MDSRTTTTTTTTKRVAPMMMMMMMMMMTLTMLLLLTFTPGVHPTTDHHPPDYQTLVTLAHRFSRLREEGGGAGGCGPPDSPQRPLDQVKLWTSVGLALMAGFGRDDRQHPPCPGRPSGLQLISQAVKQAALHQGDWLGRVQAGRGVQTAPRAHSREKRRGSSHTYQQHGSADHHEYDPAETVSKFRNHAQKVEENSGRDHDQTDDRPSDRHSTRIQKERRPSEDYRPSVHGQHLSGGHQGGSSSSQQHSAPMTTSGNDLQPDPVPDESGSPQEAEHQTSSPGQDTSLPEPSPTRPQSLSPWSRAHQFAPPGPSGLFVEVFFTALVTASLDPARCDRDVGFMASTQTWVDRVCREVESDDNGHTYVEVENEANGGAVGMRNLEDTLRNAFSRWRPERFAHTFPSLDAADPFMEQVKCFNVVMPEVRPRRMTAATCHRDLHDFLGRLSTSILMHLLQGHRPVAGDQPCEADFVSDVFSLYGTEEGHFLPVEGVQRMIDAVEKSTNCSGDVNPGPMDPSHETPSARRKRQNPNDVTKPERSAHSSHLAVNKRFSARELVDAVLDRQTFSLDVQRWYRLCPALLQQFLLVLPASTDSHNHNQKPPYGQPEEIFVAEEEGEVDDSGVVSASPLQMGI
ncbi:uncharacterized protein LOC143291899 [Babylonia areolata]|uniref:uncharacterized protein LOC143291899 n=1 Tax=Babylonia areolata TaxID=304850 RepID=UPI003FD27C13